MGRTVAMGIAVGLALVASAGGGCKKFSKSKASAGGSDPAFRAEERRGSIVDESESMATEPAATPSEPAAPSQPTPPPSGFPGSEAEGEGGRWAGSSSRGAASSGGGQEGPAAAVERMIVYHAWLRLAVHAVQEALAAVDGVTERLGGFVESSTLVRRVLRIPAARYQEAVAALKGLGEVRDFRESSWDVTEQYRNIEARIDNLRALRERFAALLAQATDMDERLAIEKELRRIELELRELEEERRVLADEAAFATLTVDVEALHVETAVRNRAAQPFAWVRSYGLQRVLAGQ